VALPVVEAPPRQPTTLPIVTTAGPAGDTSMMVISSDDQAGPNWAAPAGGHDVDGPDRREVLWQQRHVVAGGHRLAEQGSPQHGRVDPGEHLGRTGDGHRDRFG